MFIIQNCFTFVKMFFSLCLVKTSDNHIGKHVFYLALTIKDSVACPNSSLIRLIVNCFFTFLLYFFPDLFAVLSLYWIA